MKRILTSILAVSLVLCLLCNSALACTSIYVGSQLTKDHTTLFARSEDYSNSQNKLFYVSPAAKHTAGEVYHGCYGFSYTFSHDSYSYTAFSDDNGRGAGNVCPDCGSAHAHTPYEAAGTNEMGVSISATETLYPSEAALAADPFVDAGIEEAEITTIILSEAASARVGVNLLLSIYDTAGCNGGAGIFIADATETWYIENLTGHQYIALKLSDSMAMMQPNMSVIGLIDLDDTENVIASKGIVTVAQNAGCFVGNAAQNIIDFCASYAGDQTTNARMNSGLSYLTGKENRTFIAKDYTISNADADNNIVPMYTNIKLTDSFTVEDIIAFYHIDGIGSARNLETHIFEIGDQPSALSTVEWIAMDDGLYNVFIPYYPMLTSDVYSGYTVSTKCADFIQSRDASRLCYHTTMTSYVNGERVSEEGYCVLPEDWATSFYWSFDALSNLLRYGGYNKTTIQYVQDALKNLQNKIITQFTALQPAILNAADFTTASQLATQYSADTAAYVHAYILELINALLGGTTTSTSGSGSSDSDSTDSLVTDDAYLTDEGLEEARTIAKYISDSIIDGITDNNDYLPEGYDTSGMTKSISNGITDAVIKIYAQNRDNGNFDSDNYNSDSLDSLKKFFGIE